MRCSVAQAAEILGDKWTLLILRDTFFGLSSFSQFQKNLGMARNILSDRLGKLVENGLLERRQTRPGVDRYTYHLTEKGRALFPAITALMQWGDEWVFAEQGEPVHIVDRENGAPIDTVQVRAGDGRSLQANEVTFVPGPNADPALVRFYEAQREGKAS